MNTLTNLAQIQQSNVLFYVFKAEEVDRMNEEFFPCGNNLYLSHHPNKDELFSLFSDTLIGFRTYDPALPQAWFDKHIEEIRETPYVWLYDNGSNFGRPFAPFVEWKQSLEDLALKVWTENQEVKVYDE